MLKGVPSGSLNSVAKSSESIGVLPLPGIQGTPKNARGTSQPAQELSQEAPIALQTRNDLSMPDNPQQDELPDLVTFKTGKDTGTEVTLTANDFTGNPESDHPKETFNVDPLSTEDDLDAVDALLSLSGIQDENADPTTENELLMPIGGANLPLDVAPCPDRTWSSGSRPRNSQIGCAGGRTIHYRKTTHCQCTRQGKGKF